MTGRTIRPGHFFGEVVRQYSRRGIILSEFKHDCVRTLPSHSHEVAFFNLLLHGRYTENLNGRTATLKPMTTIFHNAGLTHQNEIGQSGIRVFRVDLEAQWLDRLLECGVAPQISAALPGSELSQLATRLYQVYRDRDYYSELTIEGLVLEMLALVARPQGRPERRPPAWLPKVEALLRAGFHQNPTINEIAAQFDLHPAYLSRVFRQFHHQTIGDYLHELRVQFAIQKLRNPALTLSTISAAAGFADQSHFTRVFKQGTGMTPGSFRAALRIRKTE